MPRCSFCKEQYEFPRGITVVQKSGEVKYFCSSKCRKNSQMGRDNRKAKWVKKSIISKEEAAKRVDAKNLRESKK